jgi:hypothetical protein
MSNSYYNPNPYHNSESYHNSDTDQAYSRSGTVSQLPHKSTSIFMEFQIGFYFFSAILVVLIIYTLARLCGKICICYKVQEEDMVILEIDNTEETGENEELDDTGIISEDYTMRGIMTNKTDTSIKPIIINTEDKNDNDDFNLPSYNEVC